MSEPDFANLHDEAQAEWERTHRHAKEAVDAADSLGIYAVPLRHTNGRIYWRPRTSAGYDPDLEWILQSQPTHSGWLSWADAVNALNQHLKEEEQKN